MMRFTDLKQLVKQLDTSDSFSDRIAAFLCSPNDSRTIRHNKI